MREIRFRGILKADNLPYYHKGQWVYGDYVRLCDGKRNIPHIYGCGEIEANTVGQYIGLVDKNGKEIYEGDYVVCRQAIQGNFIDEHIEMGYVEMKHGAFGLHRKQGYYRPFKDWLEDYEYEVIGNIHDNPELLKGGAE